MYDTILVGIDGSDDSNRAIEHALNLAERHDARLHALFVVDTRQYGEPALSSVEIVTDEIEDYGHSLLNDITDRADNRGIEVTNRVCHGTPDDELLAAAEDMEVDVIVIGYRGQTHDQPGRLGSVADAIIRMTDRPVLLV
ncbi:universal stress protein [Haloarculaceae archaeon H-GB2-1]|nr:universal stress protein [Haloarculaceae archaeon H-GB1-1]MEA5385850.1 universal stress protein [Haloarculaceae archaeon H-GB11]MEA5407353.1 universal stress protein [Haloarculaceae archaeon H-GB2-1]